MTNTKMNEQTALILGVWAMAVATTMSKEVRAHAMFIAWVTALVISLIVIAI